MVRKSKEANRGYMRGYMREYRKRKKANNLHLKETLQSIYDAKVEPVTQLNAEVKKASGIKELITELQNETFDTSDLIIENGLKWAFSNLATLYLVAARSLTDVPIQDLHSILVNWLTILSEKNENKGVVLVGAFLTAKRAVKRLLEYPNLKADLKTLLEDTDKNIDKVSDALNEALSGQLQLHDLLIQYEAELNQAPSEDKKKDTNLVV